MATITGFETDNKGAFIRKDPASVLDYTINWTDWLGSDTLSSVTFAISSDAETSPTLAFSTAITGSSANQVSGKNTIVYLSGGTAGVIYNITATVVTSSARTVKRSFRVKVENIQL